MNLIAPLWSHVLSALSRLGKGVVVVEENLYVWEIFKEFTWKDG